MKGYKAFNKGMTCVGKQYAENTVFEEEGGNICGPGVMHFCKNPLDVLDYYNLIDDDFNVPEFAEVEALDEVRELNGKCATKKLKIGSKISLKEFAMKSVSSILTKARSHYTAKRMNSAGTKQVANRGTLVSVGSSIPGAHVVNCGKDCQIATAGDKSTIINTGDFAQIANSGDGSQIVSCKKRTFIGNSGFCSKILSFGDQARIASAGDLTRIKMEGINSIASAIGVNCKIAGKKGDWIVLAEWGEDDYCNWYVTCVKSAQIDGVTLKEDTFYKLENGEFVEAHNIMKYKDE